MKQLANVIPLVLNDPGMATILANADNPTPPQRLDVNAPTGLRAPVIASLSTKSTLLVVTSSGRVAEEIHRELAAYLDETKIAVFPSWETLPHERLSPRGDTVGRRAAILRRLKHPEPKIAGRGPLDVVIAPIRAVLQPLVAGLGDLEPLQLALGDEADLTDIERSLAEAGYVRTDVVGKRGEFAVRGGILDVFAPNAPHPIRVDFFGDEVDEIRYFSAADQRSLDDKLEHMWAPVVREVLLTPQVRQRAEELIPQLPGAEDMLTKLAAGIPVDGMESLAPALVPDMEPLLALLPEATKVLVVDPARVTARAIDLVATTEEFRAAAWSAAAGGGEGPLEVSKASFVTYDDMAACAADMGIPWWTFGPLTAPDALNSDAVPPAGDRIASDASDSGATISVVGVDESVQGDRSIAIEAKQHDSYRGRLEAAIDNIKTWSRDNHVVLTAAGRGSVARMGEQLREADIGVAIVDEVPRDKVNGVSATTAEVVSGFVMPAAGLVVVTEADLLGRSSVAGSRGRSAVPSRRRQQIDPLNLRPGDFVVHDQHGVGRFVEMVQRSLGGAKREYLVLEYAASKKGQPADKLFVPSDALAQVSRYVGGESPSVHRLGGGDWAKTKARARKAVKEIAGALIRLYSARQASKGFAFSPDSPWQRELEEAFPFVETPDQMATINEVKADMEKSVPMDRMICGDVGYGKTEIAVRAAFKAVQDGKQVAVLVPTTLLVSQHFETFSSRFAGFPVNVRALSRFQNERESTETVQGLAAGKVDVVIGTHRLLSSSVQFKDLGLLIIDEEQRFGVEHKETLKKARTNVDVLSMSATPIPRTLEMSVTGIREMSTLATPPEERHPVLTYVGAYDQKTVTAAVRRELLREGQVFYVHNRVATIEKAASSLRELIPEARVATAHGKMSEKRLEEVIQGFWEKEYDVLVCTTIVETGLDISNANTLILERSDLLGLSQLHQLRGRVGRGRERAYAYFLYPPEDALRDEAHDRLATIAQNADLGAGMQVAMKDLEIRGAGNLLGGEQSGHIAGVGFDLYLRMIGEAVAEFRGEAPEDLGEVKVELPVEAHLPHNYVGHERLRLEAYRKLSAASTDEAVDDVMAELTDRYGTPPEPVVNLASVARLRVVARQAGVSEIMVLGSKVKFGPVELLESQELKIKRLYPGTVVRDAMKFMLVPKPTTARIGGQALTDQAVLEWAMHLLKACVVKPANLR